MPFPARWNSGYPPSGRRVPLADGAAVSTPVPDAGPPPQAAPAAGHLLVAVGSFSVADNANRAARSVAAMGLPVVQGQIQRNGLALTSVYAGPFDTAAAANAALRAARAAGFPDALIVGN